MDKKAEAINRMKMLKILPQVIEEFENGVLELSEYMHPQFPAVLYWVTNGTYNYEGFSLTEAIKSFEEEYEALVYHVQLSHTGYGDVYSFFYVSNYPEEWEMDRKLLEEGEAYVYACNATEPWCSEIGLIGFKSAMGGIERTF